MLFLHHIMSMILAKYNMLQDIVISEHINMNDRQKVMYSISAFMTIILYNVQDILLLLLSSPFQRL